MRNLICLMAFGLMFLCLELKAQDPHYSQFYSSPLNFNPAMAGTVDGTFRINTIYRDQWTSILQDPMTSFSLGADIKLTLDQGGFKKKPDFLGLGIVFNTDRIKTFDLNTTSVSLMGAFHKSLSERKTRYLGGGFLIGVVQRNVNYEDLVFQDQFNTLDAFNLPTSENFPTNNFGFVDLAAGLNYLSKTDRAKINFGVAYYHFNRPNISFYQDDNCATCGVETENRLKARMTAFASATLDINPSFGLSPRLLIQAQDQFKEATIGNNFIFKFPTNPGNAIHFGTWVRVVDNHDNFGIESIILMAGIEKKNILIGLSYDHALNDLIQDRLGMNSFELSLTYIGEHDNSFDTCPKF